MAELRLKDNQVVANSDYVITCLEIGAGIFWTEFSGIKANYTRAKYSDGLSRTIRMTNGGNMEYQPVTIAKPYDPEKDSVIYEFTKTYRDRVFSLNLAPLKFVQNQGNNITTLSNANRAWYLTGCRLISWGCASGIDTSDGSTPLKFELEFSIESATVALGNGNIGQVQ